ncbi:hypothetical protein ACKKBF_B39160 [Auxenochlorella protothecoides x Auxenochlorella symbiontica]|uniref:Mitochondrial Rho GTPase n=2 Tax=Auxenochlorella protothecoides TaxID=3075 RepID=A0A1D2A7K2_AUXPR|nr:hypothetical protein APUTEX25_000380 [Auxenochlorella protothecoides]|eukprot:RMZ54863.1 hypothetical protein APUTEX25_000380 [Auxenochlorella protothecoides]
MEGRDPTVRIAVVGDPGVGKTSLITAAATETFPDHPPPVLPPAILPAETVPECVPVVITDTSSRPEDAAALELAVQEASVVVLCFAMDRPNTLARVSRHWIPELRRMAGGAHVPVLLVGCKADARPADHTLQAAVVPILQNNPAVETCMECSAKKLQYVGEVFYLALRAVVHPTAPLFDAQAQTLRPLCSRALKRIFMLCDKDKDGILNEAELNAFQIHCFNAPLQTEELIGVKQVVAERVPEGVQNGGLTLPGFIFLHALFIERGRLETTWAVLRRYGYNNDLVLSQETLSAVNFSHAPDQVLELSEEGRAFFTSVFERCDVDDDGVLSTREQEEMFSTSPGSPWSTPAYDGVLVETSKRGLLSLRGFLAKWAYTTATEPEVTLAYALYFGLPDTETAASLFTTSRPRRAERRSDAGRRSLLRCFLFAPTGLDTGPLLEGLIAQARPVHGLPSVPITAAVAAVSLPGAGGAAAPDAAEPRTPPRGGDAPGAAGGGDNTKGLASPGTTGTGPAPPSVTLLLRPFAEEQGSVLLGSPGARAVLAAADVAAFVFDATSRESFSAAVARMLAVASAADDCLPCVLIAAQDTVMDPTLAAEVGESCSRLGVAPPIPYSGTFPGRGMYQALAGAALGAELTIPDTPSLQARRRQRRALRRAAWAGGAGLVATLAGYAAWRAYHGLPLLGSGRAAEARAVPEARAAA